MHCFISQISAISAISIGSVSSFCIYFVVDSTNNCYYFGGSGGSLLTISKSLFCLWSCGVVVVVVVVCGCGCDCAVCHHCGKFNQYYLEITSMLWLWLWLCCVSSLWDIQSILLGDHMHIKTRHVHFFVLFLHESAMGLWTIVVNFNLSCSAVVASNVDVSMSCQSHCPRKGLPHVILNLLH